MSVVKLLCRYQKSATDPHAKEIEQELDTLELIRGDKFNREEEREKLVQTSQNFDYGSFCFNLKDVQTFNHVDEIHTCIRFYNATAYTFKIKFQIFEALYTTLLGVMINDFTETDKPNELDDNASEE